MRVVLIILCIVLSRVVALGQAQMTFDFQMLDNFQAFYGNTFDTTLLRKNKVESCIQNNSSFFFDHNGRLVKSIFIPYDSATQVELYFYDLRGDLIKRELSGPKWQTPIVTTYHKTYRNESLIKDSSSSGYMCKHFEYYENKSLRQELWFGFDGRFKMSHRLERGFWFGVDSTGRVNRIIDRNYTVTTASKGQLVSNRTLFYNDNNQLVKEDEAVKWKKSKQKTFFCPNVGSATFHYDDSGRIVEIRRKKGPSQKIRYLQNGLISNIETQGETCVGEAYHWILTYRYVYRD